MGKKSNESSAVSSAPAPTREELALCYQVAVCNRATDERIVQLCSQGKVKFAIWGPGEEIHGTAAALAFHKASPNPDHVAMALHYRSGALAHLWARLRGDESFTRRLLRQQLSRATDDMSGGGRQMVYHLCQMEHGILPIQSPVGMQCDKAAGYAKGWHLKGVRDGLVAVVIGDGSTAEGDMHDMMQAISIWQLPVLVLVTDNKIAISTTPEDGRGIKSFQTYAEAYGVKFFTCQGNDWDSSYEAHYEAAKYCIDNQAPALMHITEMPRLNGHSSAGNYAFDLEAHDPILDLGQRLVADGILTEAQICKRIEGSGTDYFNHHELGEVMQAEDDRVCQILEETWAEPESDPETIYQHIYAPFPEVEESQPADAETVVPYKAAIRAAHMRIFEERPTVAAWGQDTGKLGGVFQATAGLKQRFEDRVLDTPLNEPLIVGTAMGAGLHDDVTVMAEVQFGDYSLNCYHWFVYLGNLHWSSGGNVTSSVVCRMPTDPFGGGAIYHSMCLDGFFTPIPGLVIVCPSTSWDAYGLLRTLADYRGPSLVFEPKWMYSRALGPAFPGEPTDPAEIKKLKQTLTRGGQAELPDVRVPIGKGVVRRAGDDVTIVAWGRAVWTALDAAKTLEADGVSAEVIDLRTLVPPDLELLEASATRTGALVVASEDRTFAGFGRELQGWIGERHPGLPTRVVGMKNIPAIGQSLVLENATVLTDKDIVAACRQTTDAKGQSGSGGWCWMPRRYQAG